MRCNKGKVESFSTSEKIQFFKYKTNKMRGKVAGNISSGLEICPSEITGDESHFKRQGILIPEC